MNRIVLNRIIEEAKYIIETKDTIRKTALVFGVSKSTVHKDMKDKLYFIDIDMYRKVANILKYHYDFKHIRGGESTKVKYLNVNK